jgi:hypothetical protein
LFVFICIFKNLYRKVGSEFHYAGSDSRRGGGSSKTAFVQQVVVSPWYRTLYILFYRIPNTVAKVKLKQAQRLENLYLILFKLLACNVKK